MLVDILYITFGITSEKGKKGRTQAEIDGCHFYRLPLRFTPFYIDEWKKNVAIGLKSLDLYLAEGHFPQNAPTACGAYGSSCPFLDICASQNQDIRETIKATFRGSNGDEGNEGPEEE